MSPKAFVAATSWPISELSPVGCVSRIKTSGGFDHLGLVFFNLPRASVLKHSDARICKRDAQGSSAVSFDFMPAPDNVPQFQRPDDERYFTPKSETRLLAINPACDVVALHAICVKVAYSQPKNLPGLRFNALFWSFQQPCSPPTSKLVAASSCVSLTCRLVAAAMRTERALLEDDVALEVLGLQQPGLHLLSSLTPAQAVEGLVKSGILRPSNTAFSRHVKGTALLPLLPLELVRD